MTVDILTTTEDARDLPDDTNGIIGQVICADKIECDDNRITQLWSASVDGVSVCVWPSIRERGQSFPHTKKRGAWEHGSDENVDTSAKKKGLTNKVRSVKLSLPRMGTTN